jgi:hypothetical protein
MPFLWYYVNLKYLNTGNGLDDDDTANDDNNNYIVVPVVRIWVHTDSIKYQWSWHLDCNL